MLPFEDRYTRQRRVRGVGIEGQRRIEQARVAVDATDPLRYQTALTYLTRAGVTALTALAPSQKGPGAPLLTGSAAAAAGDDSQVYLDSGCFPHAEAFGFAVAASMASGAWLALDVIRSALEPS